MVKTSNMFKGKPLIMKWYRPQPPPANLAQSYSIHQSPLQAKLVTPSAATSSDEVATKRATSEVSGCIELLYVFQQVGRSVVAN